MKTIDEDQWWKSTMKYVSAGFMILTSLYDKGIF